ncbi:EAL domain-containing protein [Pelovirga terrestris]|uniref:EAL domain-containing protein n=1 Tax=Pelovirga terrestris TaxID=2771352 RepID=A0A8J6UR73_9BACT|nr:EAL domain-containing protein [Pelovirga terrestris]MBD1400711.1 EAL domain-containing protein [Pelovirga terrestris]
MSQEHTTKLENPSAGILIVGEQLPLLYSLQALLRINGYRTDLSTSCEEAVKKLKQGRYALLLLDLQISGRDSCHLIEAVRNSCLDVETIVLVSDSSVVSIKDALRLGAYDFVRKPYRPEDLLVSVSRGVERQQTRLQLRRTELALEESERMHRFIVNNSPDFIYMLDANGVFTFVNDMIEGLLGYKRHEIIGRHFSFLIHPNNADIAHRFFSEQRTGERATRSTEIRLQASRNSQQGQGGAELLVELNAMGVYAQNNAGHKEFVGTLGSARDITERKRSEERISYQAYHDLLTRLPNRLLFADRMTQALAHATRSNTRIAVIFIDLDFFKEINDSYGHIVGDRILQQVAGSIVQCVRAEDTVSRFGGDEFSLLLVNITSLEDATIVADKILAAVRMPLTVDGHEVRLSASMGIALYPEGGDSIEALLHSADIAMYHAKDTGKDGYCVYERQMGNILGGVNLEKELSTALERNQLQVFFQPKVDPTSSHIVGMEALLRWQHPYRGLLCPGDFIHVAEKNRQIIPIGDWVLQQVCEEMLRWRRQGLPPIRVALNLSVLQLQQEDYTDKFTATIKAAGLDAELFEVQITEQGMLDGSSGVAGVLRGLSRMGVSVAIDNFGCGHSSLNYLRDYPVNTLMIDRSFVRDITQDVGRARIADGIAMMARGLNLTLMAKGVENLIQLEHLRHLGCHAVQGYLYGEAVSADAAFALLCTHPNLAPGISLAKH